MGLVLGHSAFSFAFRGHNAPPIAARGARIAENLHALHRHSNWHSWPHRHNSTPLLSCAPVYAPIGNVCTGASADRARLVFRFMAWPGMFRFTSKPFPMTSSWTRFQQLFKLGERKMNGNFVFS